MELIRRFFKDPESSFFLFGPRGTGKSTWAQTCYGNALRIDLLAPEVARTLSARPERLREMVLGNPEKRVIVLDEVQKVPELLSVVHELIEKKQDRKFILTGSSSRKLKRTGVDLLAGRAIVRTLHPFMAAELGNAFSLDSAMQIGLLPLVLASENPSDVLQSYSALYLREEVQMEGLVRNIGNFSRFLEAVSFSHASTLNASEIARECQVERKVVESYITILEDLLLAYRIPVFTKRARRATSVHPKFYLFDAGVFRSLRPRGPLDRPEEIGGLSLEGLVAQHLRAWKEYSANEHEIYFWRTRSGVEIDFIVYGPLGFWAVEVKNSTQIQSRDLRPLRSFKTDYPECQALLLYRGRERLMWDDILCLPCDDFLCQLQPGETLYHANEQDPR